MEMSGCLKILTLFCLLQVIAGYCYLQVFQHGFCTASNGATIPSGAELDFPDKCEKCSCYAPSHDTSSVHMSCCGYGVHAGVFSPPKGCKVITDEDGCSVKLVMVSDESQLCKI